MKNSKSPHRPPEISPESFSFSQKNPQGNIISRQIRREFGVSEPTVPMHGNAITPHMIRKQYNPTGQVTFFRTIHEKNTGNISATYFQNTKNTPWTIHPSQYTPANTPRTIKQRAIHKRPRYHTVPEPPPYFYVGFDVQRILLRPAKSDPGNPSTIGPPPHPVEAAHAQDPAPPRHPHREKPSR